MTPSNSATLRISPRSKPPSKPFSGRWPFRASRALSWKLADSPRQPSPISRKIAQSPTWPPQSARRVAEKQAHALASAAQTPLAGWVAVGLATEIELKNEGVAMSHCVGSYVTDCATAKSRIYHVTNPAGRSVGTLELKVDEHASKRGDWVWSVAQFKGANNALISNPTAKLFAQKVAEAYGAAARANRLGLRPARETAKTDSGRALDNNPRESAPEIASGMPRDEALGQRLTARRAQNLDYVPGDDSLDLRFPR